MYQSITRFVVPVHTAPYQAVWYHAGVKLMLGVGVYQVPDAEPTHVLGIPTLNRHDINTEFNTEIGNLDPL